MYANILVEYGAKALDQTFTYIIPDILKDNLKVGMKVKVPFRNTLINGFVLEITNNCNNNNLKEIASITDEYFCLNKELLELGKTLKELTLCSLIQAYQAMLPSSMKIKTIKSSYQKYNEYLELINKDTAINYIENNKRSIKQIELLNRLLNNEKILKKEYSLDIVKKLINENIIKINKVNKYIV